MDRNAGIIRRAYTTRRWTLLYLVFRFVGALRRRVATRVENHSEMIMQRNWLNICIFGGPTEIGEEIGRGVYAERKWTLLYLVFRFVGALRRRVSLLRQVTLLRRIALRRRVAMRVDNSSEMLMQDWDWLKFCIFDDPIEFTEEIDRAVYAERRWTVLYLVFRFVGALRRRITILRRAVLLRRFALHRRIAMRVENNSEMLMQDQDWLNCCIFDDPIEFTEGRLSELEHEFPALNGQYTNSTWSLNREIDRGVYAERRWSLLCYVFRFVCALRHRTVKREMLCQGFLEASDLSVTSLQEDRYSMFGAINVTKDRYFSAGMKQGNGLKSFSESCKSWQKGAILGSGSTGIVYEGFTEDGFFFAVKEVSLLDQGSKGQEILSHLEQEVSLLRGFRHENIVRYLGTHKDDTKLCIFLELVTKGSLVKLYERYELGDSQVSIYTKQILNGLNYLHSQNVVHRDIKCANILVDANRSVKLADFGLAKVTKLNDIKSFKGSPYWMAPEVVDQRSHNGYGLAADIWSLGCTVLEMLTGQIPYSPLEWQQALFRIGQGELPPLPNTLSYNAQDFIFKCLQVNPNDRPAAAELLKHPFVN